MIILGIDPGPEDSAAVVYDTATKIILWKSDTVTGKHLNTQLLGFFMAWQNRFTFTQIVIESMDCRGVPLNHWVRETLIWIGRFKEKLLGWGYTEEQITLLLPTKIRSTLCGTSKCTLKDEKEVIIDHLDPMRRFGQHGKGTKKAPGPFYGFTKDLWQAMAVVVAYELMVERGDL